ncbi:TPA: hypothetical protein N0F65_006639 [Lagenidium giganteum]|uniref:Uncharacterized protein n=1 Tax=Lagenidium giganteum TaxID=4803 RepID=A0AAV2ZBV5_9STRA|nr:TPA: hypothetical protein N0F65_006639 [Lagenidium giganteum]
MKHHGYHIVKVGAIPQSKLKKALNGGAITLSANDLSGDQQLVVHPENAKKIIASQKKGTGARIAFMPGEIRHDLDYHSTKAGGSIKSGGSVWSWIKDKAYPWLKENIWPVVKPIVSQPGIVNAVRKELGNQIGVGIKSGGRLVKGSQAAKDRMAALRAKRKSGGSFKLN